MPQIATQVQNASSGRLYTAQFFQVFAAVTLFMTGVGLQFHFGQFLEFLGHDVNVLGYVLSAGTGGALLLRFHLGHWIDRFGCRPSWVVGTAIVALSVGGLQFVDSLWLIVLLRVVAGMAMASVMTTVAVFASQIAPPRRRAESIGIMGLAGFTGMMIGPTAGDWIFSGDTRSIVPYRVFFTTAALCTALAGVIMLLVRLPRAAASLDKGGAPPAGERGERVTVNALPHGGTLRVVLDHWPGTILLINMVFSAVFCLHMSFLERLAETRGFKDIKLFFLVYGPVAIALRIVFRRLPEQIGRQRTVIVGMGLLAAGLLLLIGVDSQWGLILPGVLMGAGHSFIFPSMIDLGAARLPPEHRGMGTSLIMGAGDLGMLIGFAVLGEVIRVMGFDAAIIVLASGVLLSTAAFAWRERRGGATAAAEPRTGDHEPE